MMRVQTGFRNGTPAETNRRRSITTALRRSSFGLAALSASISHHALAQSLAATDPASWRTKEYQVDWGLEAIHAADAYAAGYTGLGVTVGVVDSGFFQSHSEFADGRVKSVSITGTFGSDGFYFMDWFGNPINRSPQQSYFKKGDSYSVPGPYNGAYNDSHGTHVTGTIAASRDGDGMHGVAFNANVYVANTQSTDKMTYGANADYSYFKNAYASVSAAGARVINTSWGNAPPSDDYNSLSGLRSSYAKFLGKKTYFDALDEVAKQYDTILVFAAGNTRSSNPDIRAVLPYFRPDIERNWVAVGATRKADNGQSDPGSVVLDQYSVRAGSSKYWYIAAPGSAITSTAAHWSTGDAWDPKSWHIDPGNQTGYATINGTSMAAPHATGALAVILQRYPYMTNEQARDVLLTTAYHRDAVQGTPDANPNAPNAVWGWGVIDLAKAMRGPGQFLGPVAANLPDGTNDTWSNAISEDALVQRKQENDAEAAAWATRKAAQDPKLNLAALQAALPATRATLDAVVTALRSRSQAAFLASVTANDADPVGSRVLAAFLNARSYWPYWPFTNLSGGTRAAIGNQLASYLADPNGAQYTQIAAGIAAAWQTEVQVETTRIAAFAGIPTRGSLIKLGAGTLTLAGTNSYSGGTTVAGGTLSVSREANLGAAGAPLTFDGGVLQITGTGFTATARPITWGRNGGGLDIADPANGFTLAQALAGSGGLAKLGAGTLTLAGTNTYTGATTVAAGTLLARGGQAIGDRSAVTVASGATLALADAETVGSLAGLGRVALGSARLTAGGDDSSTTFAGTLDGAGGLTKAGAGTLTLAGANAYTGGTTIAAGTLQIGAGGTAGSLTGDVADAGILAFNRSDDTTFAGAVSGPGSLVQRGGGTLTLAGTNSYAGGTAILAGTLQIGAGGTTGSLTGDVADAGILAFNRSDDTTFAGAVSGPGAVIKRGAGTLTLTAAHGFTGPATVAAGGLALTASASLAAPVVTLAGTTLTQAGTLSGGLTNAGTAIASGAIAGGLTNTGTAITSGTVAGGVTNTGALTATAGALNGPIRNAGQVAVTGPVSSDAGFANAAQASLTVTGRYGLAGGLDNAGTVAVAEGGRLLAGRIANAGLLTVAAQGSVVDDLVNTGRLVNAGAYTADAVNAAGATLVNTGTFATVSAPFANAGTLVTTGSLTGGLTNTGFVQAAGVLAGPVANAPGAMVALTGPTAGLTRLTNDGAFDLGGTALTVGALTGTTAAATLGNGQLTVGTDGSSTGYAGQIVDGAGPTSLTKLGAGTLTLTGANSLSGPVSVYGGELAVTGGLPNAAVSLGAGSRLTGAGWFGSLALGAGSALAPGAGPGALGRIAVAGSLTLAPGSVYRVDATPDGRSDRVAVGGTATVAGARVEAVAGSGLYAPRTRYTILSAAGGVQGRFAGVSSTFAFLTPFLAYAPDAVVLTLARNDLDFAAVARTRDQRAAAGAVQAGAVGSVLYDAVAVLSAPQARAAFAALSGDGHASLAATAFAGAGLVREAVLDRLRWDGAPAARAYGSLPATDAADRPEPPAPGVVPVRRAQPEPVSLWGQGLGSLGHARADGNAAGLSRQSAGFVIGVDARLDGLGAEGLGVEGLGVDGLRLGAVGGHVETSFASPGQVQTGTLASTFGGVYGSLGAGPAVLRFGALAADEPARLRRVVAFPGLTDTPTARTGGRSVQGFGEAGYRIALGAGAALEPFVGAGAVALGRDRFAEQGGAAALTGAARGSLLPTATAGLRAEARLDPEAALPVSVHALAGYRRTFGDGVPAAALAFRGTGARFVSAGLPIDRDALVAEAGLAVLISPAASLGLSYTGQIGARAQDHAAQGSFTYRF
ncbi:S8 family serine peptidase [Methylobacterium sp. J-026]|uniref:S8 family serine peptidase n=1 Tax=Methylobacterium sp. J-026 TaxID=2836624 RepID=UPI0028C3A211|nr:S8 family serine peptidase [Methylobacterium sp. J-026]